LGVTIANPDGWPGGGNLAAADKLAVDVDAMAYIRGRKIVIPAITVDSPKVDAQQLADGRNNWTFPSSNGDAPAQPGAGLAGPLRLPDGSAVVLRQLGEIGYVRGILEKLDELDRIDVAYAPITRTLRNCVQRFDLQAYARVLEEARA